jgi:hypothetical protein
MLAAMRRASSRVRSAAADHCGPLAENATQPPALVGTRLCRLVSTKRLDPPKLIPSAWIVRRT